jgi:broad specificity phosphatase PhoE
MEIVFVCHGQGEHTQQIPESYKMENPGLTDYGKHQAERLRTIMPLTERHAVIASPTRRTLQTAQLWCKGSHALRFVHPAAGPRQFPQRFDFQTLPCDEMLEPSCLSDCYSDFSLPQDVPPYMWLQGINTLPNLLFEKWAEQFISWCRKLEKETLYIVSHDGTIASYMQLITGTKLTRRDLLPDAGWIPMPAYHKV